MGIDTQQLRDFIIIPTLEEFNSGTDAAINLVLGTCAQESKMGTYVKQLEDGPALGIYQMEPNTFYDIIDNYLKYKRTLLSKLMRVFNIDCIEDFHADRLIYDLKFATIFCRIHYLRIAEKLPLSEDIHGLAEYWKKYYNTSLGKGKINEFIDNYELYIN